MLLKYAIKDFEEDREFKQISKATLTNYNNCLKEFRRFCVDDARGSWEDNIMDYSEYNREERWLCAHLFRLLHEGLNYSNEKNALADILTILALKKVSFVGDKTKSLNPHLLDVSTARIYTEVALIRDAYYVRKPDVKPFMDRLVKIVQEQEQAFECRLYSELPEYLNNPKKTHPKQIAFKGKGILGDDEKKVYGAIQGMFNAKPDLVIIIGGYLIVFEAKFTEKFDNVQLKRTWNIAQVWASEILYRDLGFAEIPSYTVLKLGDSKMNVDISWQQVLEIAKKYYPNIDGSLIAFKHAVQLLNKEG